MAMKEQDVILHLEKYGIQGKTGYSIFTMPTPLTGEIKFTDPNFRFQVLNFSDSEIAIIDINQVNNKIVDNKPEVIPINIVTGVSFKEGFLLNEMTIETTEGYLTYKVMKIILNKKWHRANYKNLLVRFKGK